MRNLLPLLVAGLVLAGCVGGSQKSVSPDEAGLQVAIPQDWAERAVPYGAGHDHFDVRQHQNLSTTNFRLLGWNPLISPRYGGTAGQHLCGDASDGGAKRYAVVHGLSTDVAFVLVDVTDGASPQVVGELDMPFTSTRDLSITPDGKFVVLGTSSPKAPEKGPAGAAPDATPTWRSDCNEGPVPVRFAAGVRPTDNAPLSNGVVLVNIADVKSPVIESYHPLPVLGAHSMYANQVAGTIFVLASVVNLVAAVSYFMLFDVVPDPVTGHRLEFLSVISESPLAANAPLINGHDDGVIQIHPGTGKTLAYLAHWHQGLLVVDLTDPRQPEVIGRWSDNPAPNADLGNNDHGDVHEALPLDTLWNGRHYTFVGQEILGHPTSRPSGYVKALDTTDPTHPREVAHWNLPVEVAWSADLQFSTHYLSRVDATVFVSHYHAGVWAIDASALRDGTQGRDGTILQLPAIGVFVPANVSPQPPPKRSYQWTPTVMETNALKNGDVVVWDSSSGCYVVHFDASDPAPQRVWQAD